MAAEHVTGELNSLIRDVNLAIESYEQKHQENKRVILKLVQDFQLCMTKSRSKQNGESLKRPSSTILAEEHKPLVLRSSRSAAKAATSKIKQMSVECDNAETKGKRRCLVKLERVSASQPILDIIDEELEVIDSSSEVCVSIIGKSQIVNQVHISSAPVLPVHKENSQEMPKGLVNSAAVSDQPVPNFSQEGSTGDVATPSGKLHKSPTSSDVPVNSTFPADAVQLEALKCNLTFTSDKNNSDEVLTGKSPQCLTQNCTFVISTESPNSPSDKMLEETELVTRTPLSETQAKNTKERRQAKLESENISNEKEEVYINLQNLIKDSPVRVTRTKTRALARIAAAASTAESASATATIVGMNAFKVNGYSDTILSPPFQKLTNMTSAEDSMKENYNFSLEKTRPNVTKDLNSVSRLKYPLSSNNSLSSSSTQSSKLNIMGMGTVISHCETFLTKNPNKLVVSQINQKLLEDRKHQEEKVIEAEKKREKLLKEKAEQQRRNNEARAAKVAKTREQLERQRAMQQQQQEREKQERLRIAQQKREEEATFKRQMAQLRAAEAEEKRKQEEQQLQSQALKKKEREESEKKALQLKKEAEELSKAKDTGKIKETKVKPFALANKNANAAHNVFGTNDIYSGDESEDEEIILKKVYPTWATANRARALQLSYQEMYISLLSQLFQSEKHTPDLTKIFETVPHRALVRTSSAVWKTPPCFK